jgi:hypothetical protein
MGLNLNNLLLEDKKENYAVAKLTRNKINLKPSRKKINQNKLKKIGYSAILTVQNPPVGENYPPLGQDYIYHKSGFAKKCMENFIVSSNQHLENQKADYILLKNLKSENMITRWQVSAEISYMKIN